MNAGVIPDKRLPVRRWLACTALLGLTALALYAAAWQLTRSGIDRQARYWQTLFEAGATPWDFKPRAAADLVANRVFGEARLRETGAGLELQALDDRGYEIGIPLATALPLQRFPVAQLELASAEAVTLQWRLDVQAQHTALVSQLVQRPAADGLLQVNLADLAWVHPGTGRAAPPPARATSLRLRIVQAPGSVTTLSAIDWQPAARVTGQAPRVLVLDDGSIAAMLQQRDRLRQQWPAALIVSHQGVLQSARWLDRTRIIESIVLALWLLAWSWACALAWRRRSRQSTPLSRSTALIQCIACLLPFPAWSIGLFGGPDPDAFWMAAAAAALLLSLWLAWRCHGTAWAWLRWQGRSRWCDWLLPLLPAAVITLWILLAGAQPQSMTWTNPAVYLAWATLQQVLLLAVILPRLQRLVPARWLVIGLLGLLFAMAHLPNGLLAEGVLLAEILWAWAFVRRPVLLPVACGHALAGMLLGVFIADLPLRSLEVGMRFVQLLP